MTVLQHALRSAATGRERRGVRTDAERLRLLPEQDFSQTPGLVEKWTRRFQRVKDAPPLWRVQAEILEVAEWAASLTAPIGLLGNVGVGMGKTLAFLLLPEVFDAERPVLLLPASMRAQYAHDKAYWQRFYTFRDARVVYYSELSRPNASRLLQGLRPDLIMADEAHALKNPQAARTRRFLRYMSTEPRTRFVAMSGTLTGSSIDDYAHLARLALRRLTPFPLSHHALGRWASVLDVGGKPDDLAWASLSEALPEAATRDVTTTRRAFGRRLRNAAGVISTLTPSCKAELQIEGRYPDPGEAVTTALAALRDGYELPNGEAVIDATHFARAAAHVSTGFYYIWDWPDEPDHVWLEARNGWRSAGMQYLAHSSKPGVDSLFLLEQHVRKTGKPLRLARALDEWNAQRHKKAPPVVPIWFSAHVLLFVHAWAEERRRAGKRALLWYRSSTAMEPALTALGIPVFGAGGATPSPTKHPIAALSIPVHYKGRNYQAWDDQLVIEPPPSGLIWQQLLARTHRPGQLSPAVRAEVLQHTWPLRRAWSKALENAEYIEGTMEPQRLLFASLTNIDTPQTDGDDGVG